MHAPDRHADLLAPQTIIRCPKCASPLSYVHEYGPKIVPNGQRIEAMSASYVYRCPNEGLLRVFANGQAEPV